MEVQGKIAGWERATGSVPPQVWFVVSAIFHYAGPSFAVLLFPAVGVFGVAWLRVASAAGLWLAWSNPWRVLRAADRATRRQLVALGLCLGVMNTVFYLALDRLPMGLVAAIEFAGVLGLAACGLRTRRNFAALALCVAGVALLIDVKWKTDPLGLGWAVLNGGLFVAYVILSHRISRQGAQAGIQRLGVALAVAALVVTPLGLARSAALWQRPILVLAGVGVGLCSSIIPYACDQLALTRLARTTFALMLALLPALAAVFGALILRQLPGSRDLAGIALVMAGVALHRPPP